MNDLHNAPSQDNQRNQQQEQSPWLTPTRATVIAALITALSGIIVAIITGLFGLLPASTPVPIATNTPTQQAAVASDTPTATDTPAQPVVVVSDTPTNQELPELGTQDNPVILALVASDDTNTLLASSTAITDRLSEITSLAIKPSVFTSYAASIEAMCDGEAQAAVLNNFAYVAASNLDCADAVLVGVQYGLPTYAGQIITRVGSGITSIEDLAGKSFCRPGEFSTSGWIVPSITMQAAGLFPDLDLSEIRNLADHEDVIRSVYSGECDAGATYVDARGSVKEEFPDVYDMVVVIQESAPIPNDALSFHPDTPDEIVNAIVDALLVMVADEGGDAELFASNDFYGWLDLKEIDDTFYDPFRLELRSANVDAVNYLYE